MRLPGAYYPQDGGDDAAGGVRLRDRHQSFRTGANARLQRGSSAVPHSPSGLASLTSGGYPPGDEAAMAAAAARKFRRRWDDSAGGGSQREEDVKGGGGGDGGPPQRGANTGHLVRMRRSEAWGKFLAYEGSCQVRGGQEISRWLGQFRLHGDMISSCARSVTCHLMRAEE